MLDLEEGRRPLGLAADSDTKGTTGPRASILQILRSKGVTSSVQHFLRAHRHHRRDDLLGELCGEAVLHQTY